MKKVEYGVKCKVCGSLPQVCDVATASGLRYFNKCPKCPPPVKPYVMRETAAEARGDWERENGQVISQAKLDAAMRAVRFLLELDADRGETISDQRVKEEFQFMLDNHLHELFGAASTTMMKMVQQRVLRPPPRILTSLPVRPTKPALIVPQPRKTKS